MIMTPEQFIQARCCDENGKIIRDTITIDVKTEICDVDMYEDCHDIREAIRVALKGACLIK